MTKKTLIDNQVGNQVVRIRPLCNEHESLVEILHRIEANVETIIELLTE